MKERDGHVPCLILVSGPPASGKTTLARRLAAGFGLPAVHKDAIKESLFGTLGVRSPEGAQGLGRASIALLYDFVERLLASRVSVIAESNFHARADSERIAALGQRIKFETLQLYCTASEAVLIQRFHRRSGTAERHPGHGAQGGGLGLELRSGVWQPLCVSGPTVIVQTDDLDAVDYTSAYQAVREALGLTYE